MTRWSPIRRGRARRWPLLFMAMATTVLGVDACAAGGTVRLEALAPPGPGLVWPTAPERPRIRHLTSFAVPSDLGFRRSLIGRVASFLRGSTGNEGIHHPYGIDVTAEDVVYVVDSSARGVHRFDLLKGRYRLLTHDDLQQPIGVSVRSPDSVYVSDPQAGLVLILDSDGDEVGRISDGLNRPTGLALDRSSGVLYVVDTGRHEVLTFGPEGELRGSFGGRGRSAGQLNYPTNVAIGADGAVYVTDSMNFRVQVFGRTGEPLRSFGGVGDGLGQFARPKGIGVDARGNVLVVEGLFDVVNIFDDQGRLLLTFGGPGSADGAFWLATGIAVDDRDRVFVADTYNGRIQVFQLLPDPNP